ncbi:hypothetical protein [Mucilaginibacter gotjawali]|uniref:Uncharacterized protein n=2 Tax=Mucilaginibacter gotjawali TaxID=1550579 RepID=A0A839SN88_9SPHI|nr:hypothetical protein [Mucilaginibacter gotjawali]MBB3058694.1 hypothetical protein [Mucilaginibacter gotjawali]BAU55836.1 hypothetical protein MgSA37_04028 [Mucilaginibacter gotjawali]
MAIKYTQPKRYFLVFYTNGVNVYTNAVISHMNNKMFFEMIKKHGLILQISPQEINGQSAAIPHHPSPLNNTTDNKTSQ